MKKIIHIYKLLLPYLYNTKQARLATLSTMLLIILDVVATTYFPYTWKNLISTDIQTKSAIWFLENTVLLFVLWIFVKNSRNLREISFFPITNQAIKEIRLKTIFKVHTVNLRILEKYKVQEVINATNRVSQSVRAFMHISFINIFPSIAKIISLSVTLLSIHKLCFGIIGASYAGLTIGIFCLKYYRHAKYKAWHLSDNAIAAIGQNLDNTAMIRFNPPAHNSQLHRLLNLEANAWKAHNIWFYLLDILEDLVFYSGTGIAFCLLMLDYSRGAIGLDKIVLIYGLIASIRGAVVEITHNLTRFIGSMVDFNKTLDILNLPSENKPLQVTSLSPQPIYIKQLSFSYNKSKKLLENINLTINPGDKIGIFGPSGRGKSTLCQIIAGLIEPTSGSILYGDLPMAKISPTSLGNVLRYIPQLYHMQVLSEEQHEYGVSLKRKAFSGGEYQRYLLQEVLQSKPQIAILDETINALDEPSAKQILTEILYTVPTVIVVSHSQTLLSNMKCVFELKDGHLVEIKSN